MMMLFTGAFIGINRVTFANNTSFGEIEEVSTVLLEISEICPEFWTEEDEVLLEEIRAQILEMEWEPPLCDEQISFEIAWAMLHTPRERHLDKSVALRIGVEWIYEEFGIDVDVCAYGFSPYMWLMFEHESVGINNRSFWIGGYFDDDVDINFSLDGITGERVCIHDRSQPFEYSWMEISLGNMNFKVTDTTGVWMYSAPSYTALQMPYHLSAEEVAILVAEYVYENFGEKIDGLYVELMLSNWDCNGDLIEQTLWLALVGETSIDNLVSGHNAAVEKSFFHLSIDAATGELIFIGDHRAPGLP